MLRISGALVIAAMLGLPGCLAIGNGCGGEATMADEIRELEDLRDDGKINHHQYQAGVNKILYSTEVASPQGTPYQQHYVPQ
jgi:hypothetical protein